MRIPTRQSWKSVVDFVSVNCNCNLYCYILYVSKTIYVYMYRRFLPCRNKSYCIVSCCVVSCRVVLSCLVLYRIVSYRIDARILQKIDSFLIISIKNICSVQNCKIKLFSMNCQVSFLKTCGLYYTIYVFLRRGLRSGTFSLSTF